MSADVDWSSEREQLLGRTIAELGLTVAGSRVERLTQQLHDEMRARGVPFLPPVYLSDEWGCPDGTPLIGVPFYLADERLERLEAEHAGAVEDDDESMRYLRHEAGHAVNYAYRLHERDGFAQLFGDYARPYEESWSTDPWSRDYVRHILGWYAQKHPDEDFAETFAVWLTPGLDWQREYAGWGAARKLEWVDRTMASLPAEVPPNVVPGEDDLPVQSMRWTVAEHYEDADVPDVGDGRQFDIDLARIFAAASVATEGMPASQFVRRHEHELVVRISYWTSATPTAVRTLVHALAMRADALALRTHALESTTLIELTAFGTAVLLHWHYARVADAHTTETS